MGKKKVPVGRTVMVRNGCINKNTNSPNDRRTHVVIEINNDDLALVRLTTKKPNTTQLKKYKDGKSYFKHFVEIENINGQPLRVGNDITQNHKNLDLHNKDIVFIKSTISKSKEKDDYNKKMIKFRNKNKK